ncbi:MAG: lipoprotein [Burkholderiales bacterium]|nr:lipoprotein [Burkholderiales bacterium]
MVKPVFHLFRFSVLVLSASLLCACGQRGPLYLPGKQAATPSQAANPQTPSSSSASK